MKKPPVPAHRDKFRRGLNIRCCLGMWALEDFQDKPRRAGINSAWGRWKTPRINLGAKLGVILCLS